MQMDSVLRRIVPAALLTIAFGGTAFAQAQGVLLKREAELNASIFFGNSSQRLAAARAGVSRADSSIELAFSARYTYADVETDAGLRAVNRRSWDAAGSLDLHPFAKVSPFIFGNVESSLEKQIELRYGAGGGGKYVIARDSVLEHNVSLALLGEKTTPREDIPEFDDDLLLRWAAQHKLQGKLSAAVSYSSTTFYRPRFDDLADYTLSSVNSLSAALNSTLSLTFTFIDNYDSEARVRGAESNNDGQILFGLKASW